MQATSLEESVKKIELVSDDTAKNKQAKQHETSHPDEFQKQPVNDTDASQTDAEEPKQIASYTAMKDNGIFEFMSPERAIELYKRIHAEGMPNLEWAFHGRRKLGYQERDDKDSKADDIESQGLVKSPGITINTEFDFDEDFSELQTDTSSFVNDSLQLKKRREPSSDRKTNLSDIMSDIMKESHQPETQQP